MLWRLRETTVSLIQGDITAIAVDAIVNAANANLAGGGGVDGAIHRAGGPSILAECRALDGCPTGSAVHTGAGLLHAMHVIHAVAPRWRGGGHGELCQLASAYRSALVLADSLGDKSIAFPSLGTGIYGNPLDRSAEIALTAARDYIAGGTLIEIITFVLLSATDLAVYDGAARVMFGSPA